MRAMTKALILWVCIFAILFSLVFGIQYLVYKSEVKTCCKMYREYVLDGSNKGWCQYISFMDYLKDIKGCAIVDYNEEGYITTLNGGSQNTSKENSK